jgi:hypothetical protein
MVIDTAYIDADRARGVASSWLSLATQAHACPRMEKQRGRAVVVGGEADR